ncbi:transporter substrate-binding domain-containing protein [Arcobacteraceae bacterium]|nr:transporter substrate-binding domain-containing protein [Arcobacteraceae bacterium]
MKIIICILIFFNVLFAQTTSLTKKEKAWIRYNEIKIGVPDLYPLSYINKDNQMDGFSNDILKLIIKKYYLKTKIVSHGQNSTLANFNKNSIDIIPIITNTKTNSSLGQYSSEILQIKNILFVKKEQNNINSFEDLKYKKVAIITEETAPSKITEKNYHIKMVKTKNIQDSVEKLLRGDVDAIIASPIVIQKYLEDNLIIGLKAMPLISFEPSSLYFFTNKKKTELYSIIEKGLNSITIREEKEIFDKWFLKDLANLPLKLTKEEINHLSNKQSINMCVNPNAMPYQKIKNHKHIGIVADYIKDFQEKIGIPINLVETNTMDQSLEYLRNRKCDILSLVVNTENTKKYISFTKPYITAPLVLVTKRSVTFISDLKTLHDKKIGIQKNFTNNEKIRQEYPDIDIVEQNNLRESLKKVEKGKLFGHITTHLNVAYAIQEEFYGNLQISGKFENESNLSIGVRNDDPILLNIFEKVVISINDELKQKIMNNWVSIKFEKIFDYQLLWKILTFFLFILLIILYTYIMQRKYIRKITKAKDEIETLNSTLEKKVQKRTNELELSNNKLILKTLELEELNSSLDIRIKEEINNRKKQEELLIQQSKLAEMGEMISMIAHQWRQPLSALSTIIQNIHLRYSLEKLDKDYLEKQRILSKALTEKMSKTIEDFRNFFKPNKEKQSFSIKDAINQTIFLIDDSFKSSNIKIECTVLDDISIYGYESEFSQVLLNILTNAKDAFLENNIDDPNITIETKQVQTHIKILISDNAGGISKSIINKIFEPYFTTKTNYNGTGLGLYMSKIIIEQNMQGQLSVQNIPNGVKFSIYIPININHKLSIEHKID